MIKKYYYPVDAVAGSGHGGFLHKVLQWLGKVLKDVVDHLAPMAVSVTELIKDALNNGSTGFIAGLLDQLTHSEIPTEVLDVLKKNIMKVIAVELAIEGLPDNPTEDDILAFEQRILAAFNVTSNKSKFYTLLASQVYGILKQTIQDAGASGHVTFAQIVAAIEEAYQKYLQDLQDQGGN